MKRRNSLTSCFFFGLMTVFSVGAAFAESAQIGVLGLYRGDRMHFDSSVIAGLDCTIQRQGMIGAAQGNLDIGQPNQFLLLACETSVLEDVDRRHDFAGIAGSDYEATALEGDLTDFEVPDVPSEVSERQYILKISTYNNRNLDERESDLVALDAAAAQQEDTYVTEFLVAVEHAMGMRTPDELVVLYYDTPAAGDRFRDQNKDLLNSIEAFNKEHLTNFVYYVGQALK